jgi:hypothetical protein
LPDSPDRRYRGGTTQASVPFTTPPVAPSAPAPATSRPWSLARVAARAARSLEGKVFLAVLSAALAFSAYTRHVWEDYWITFRASRNLATGHGLVFTPGERLHTFTSPLGVLLPAGLSWLTGSASDDLVVWLFRLVSMTALAAGMVLLLRLALRLQRHRLSSILTVALVALDAKTLDFSINGMETGLLVFFLALTLHGLLVAGPRRALRIGVGWAGLMWTRPDGCVYIAILAATALVFPPDTTAGRTRTELWKTLLRAGFVGAVLYLPWFAWAWWYYGSPVPHTVVAKATNGPGFSPLDLAARLLLSPFSFASTIDVRWQVFMPPDAYFGGWHYTLQATCLGLALVASFAWLVPLLRAETRMLSLAFFLAMAFLNDVVQYLAAWYLPAVEVFGYLTIGFLFDQVFSLATRLPELGWDRGWFRRLPLVLRVSAAALIAGQASVTVCVARQMAEQQELIENGIRRPIGMWLRDHARTPHDTVFLEPLGYIGYYSQLKMLDYPGLSSREMVDARRRLGPANENQAYLELKPDWLVLRPAEVRRPNPIIDPTRLGEFYELVQVFDASDRVRAVPWLAGREYLQNDQTFLVFHRKSG